MKAGQARLACIWTRSTLLLTHPTWLPFSNPSSKLTRFLGGRLMSEDCGVPDCSYKHTLQTAVKWVHPKWECPTRKRLNQLLSKRECIPFPPPLLPITRTTLYRHGQHLSSSALPVRSSGRNPFMSVSGPSCFC